MRGYLPTLAATLAAHRGGKRAKPSIWAAERHECDLLAGWVSGCWRGLCGESGAAEKAKGATCPKFLRCDRLGSRPFVCAHMAASQHRAIARTTVCVWTRAALFWGSSYCIASLRKLCRDVGVTVERLNGRSRKFLR
jgi:hypothetical protein